MASHFPNEVTFNDEIAGRRYSFVLAMVSLGRRKHDGPHLMFRRYRRNFDFDSGWTNKSHQDWKSNISFHMFENAKKAESKLS